MWGRPLRLSTPRYPTIWDHCLFQSGRSKELRPHDHSQAVDTPRQHYPFPIHHHTRCPTGLYGGPPPGRSIDSSRQSTESVLRINTEIKQLLNSSVKKIGNKMKLSSCKMTLPAQITPASCSCPQPLLVLKPFTEHCWRDVTLAKHESLASTSSPPPPPSWPKWEPPRAFTAFPHSSSSHITSALLMVQSASHTGFHTPALRTSSRPLHTSLLFDNRISKLSVKSSIKAFKASV